MPAKKKTMVTFKPQVTPKTISAIKKLIKSNKLGDNDILAQEWWCFRQNSTQFADISLFMNSIQQAKCLTLKIVITSSTQQFIKPIFCPLYSRIAVLNISQTIADNLEFLAFINAPTLACFTINMRNITEIKPIVKMSHKHFKKLTVLDFKRQNINFNRVQFKKQTQFFYLLQKPPILPNLSIFAKTQFEQVDKFTIQQIQIFKKGEQALEAIKRKYGNFNFHSLIF